MMALLSPRVWLAIACAVFFAGCNFASYRAGKANVRADWNVEKLATAAAVLTATDAARTREQALQATVTKAQNESQQRQKVLIADAGRAHAAADSLRDDLAAANSQLASASSASLRGRVAALDTVFGECTKEVERLAEDSAGLASDVQLVLQAWPK